MDFQTVHIVREKEKSEMYLLFILAPILVFAIGLVIYFLLVAQNPTSPETQGIRTENRLP